MHYVNKRKIASQNKTNLTKCAQNCEKDEQFKLVFGGKFFAGFQS